MRKFVVLLTFALLPIGTAHAQPFCPGVTPWVFDDVQAGDPFCGFITWMATNNVTLGCQVIDASHRLYCPDDFVTRKQMAAFMNRTANAVQPLTCAPGQVMKWNGAAWTCSDDNIGGSGGGGTVTSVLAGTGLVATPNPIVGAGVLNLALGYQLPQSCANGQVAKSNGAGGWTCGTDNAGTGTVTNVATGAGLTGGPITGMGTIAIAAGAVTAAMLAQNGCTNGQVLKWNGSAWACAADVAGPANAFVQGGNAFGTTAVLGTNDAQALELHVGATRVMRYEPTTRNAVGGHPGNAVNAAADGQTIAGGGVSGTNCLDPATGATNAPCTNSTLARLSTVGGGLGNRAGGAWSVIAGGSQNATGQNYGTVAGGYGNYAGGQYSTVPGGFRNTASGQYSKVGGGNANTASAQESTVGGGTLNDAIGAWSTVGGGYQNEASGDSSTIGGGQDNIASGQQSTVGGGSGNTASGSRSSVGGGSGNTASGNFSWAGGRRAKTQTAAATPEPHHGAFVWAGEPDFDFLSAANNEFAVRATGGVRFVTQIDGGGNATRQVTFNPNAEIEFGNPQVRQMLNLWGTLYGIGIQAAGMYFRVDAGIGSTGGFNWYRGGVHDATADAPGTGGFQLMRLDRSGNLFTAGAINPPSDAGLKTDFRTIDAQDVLERVVAMPIATWRYREDPAQQRHVGPTAQDFRAAFGLGGGDKTIATVDADGVALAAIQGLNAKVEARLAEKDAAIAARDAEIAQLKAGLAELRRAVELLNARVGGDERVAAR